PRPKEIRFFNHPSKTLEDYLANFKQAKHIQKCGEWTPDYFHSDDSITRIKKFFPHAKLLTIFRHPVERAFSNWKHATWAKRIKGNFAESFKYWRVRDRSIYSEMLRKWWTVFPKEQLKILWYDDIVNDPLAYLQDIFKFLEVDSDFVPPNYDEWFRFKYHDSNKQDAILTPQQRQRWLKFYKPYTEELEDLTGKDLTSWKK